MLTTLVYILTFSLTTNLPFVNLITLLKYTNRLQSMPKTGIRRWGTMPHVKPEAASIL